MKYVVDLFGLVLVVSLITIIVFDAFSLYFNMLWAIAFWGIISIIFRKKILAIYDRFVNKHIIIYQFIKVISGFVVMVALISFCVLVYNMFSDNKICVEDELWDEKEKQCRSDCFMIDDDRGCIPLDKDYDEMRIACKVDLEKCDMSVLRELYKKQCLQAGFAYNISKEECDFEFKKKDCEKLKGKWEYPDICKK